MGDGSTAHVVPFQASTNVRLRPAPSVELPTATHAEAEVQDTPESELFSGPVALGVGSISFGTITGFFGIVDVGWFAG